jgi:hypothetical protein
VGEVAKMWGLGIDSVRKVFECNPDVLRMVHPETLHKRK